MMMRKKDRR